MGGAPIAPGAEAAVECAQKFFQQARHAAPFRLSQLLVFAGQPGHLDDRTLAFPNYDGNGMYLSMGNIDATRRVGLLFIDFERQRRMRVDGFASIAADDGLLERYPEAQFIVRVDARYIYPNCPRYIHKYQLVERSAFVPRQNTPTPIPGWKQSEWASDVLPVNDPARRLER